MNNPCGCVVEGCERQIMYKADQLCQMHYFRRMRNGSFELKRQRFVGDKVTHHSGYILVYDPEHPLSQKGGYVFEHRAVMYERHGDELPPCDFCGAESNWASRSTHIDHIDEDKSNNAPGNLRVLCNGCNVGRSERDFSKMKGAVMISCRGKVMTPTQWAREEGVVVCGATIRKRFAEGWSAEEAIFRPGITHHGPAPKPPAPPKHTRKNAVVLEIDGVKKTAAEWARDPACPVTRGAIVLRKRSGMSDYDCVYKPPSAPFGRPHTKKVLSQ